MNVVLSDTANATLCPAAQTIPVGLNANGTRRTKGARQLALKVLF